MCAFSAVDPILLEWSRDRNIQLHTSFDGKDARFFYINPSGVETFQVWFQLLRDDYIVTSGSLIESDTVVERSVALVTPKDRLLWALDHIVIWCENGGILNLSDS